MLTLYLLVLIFGVAQCDSCYFPPSSPLSPPKPELPNVFQTRIEINSNQKNSITRRMFYDFNKRKSAIIDQENNLETHYIFDYPTNQIHITFAFANETTGTTVEGDSLSYSPITCDSFSLTDVPLLNYLFGFKKINNSYIEPDSVYHALNFKGDQYYNGTELVRGIVADVYQSCQYISALNSNFSATFYFTRFNYSMPNFNAEYTRIPLRAVLVGTRTDENMNLVDFKEIYDFYDFRVNHSWNIAFMTPPGVVCLKRKVTIPTPNVTKQFKFSEEMTSNGHISYIKDLSYNELFKVVRYERRNSIKEADTFYSRDPLINIHDYNIGVSFTINKNLGNCSITSIPVLSFDLDQNFTNSNVNLDGSYVIRLKSPESFLLLDSEYVHTGQRKVNNVPSDIFISDRGNLNQTIITEYAFSNNQFLFQETNHVEKNVPVSLSIIDKKLKNTIYSSFFDFDSSVQPFDQFDVTQCFVDKLNYDFRIKFPYKSLGLTLDSVRDDTLFKFDLILMLNYLTKESFTRFSDPKVSASTDGYLYVRSSILPQPPPISMFTALPKFWLIVPTIAVLRNLTSPEECAAYCIRDITCLSFDFGITNFNCFLNKKHSVNGSVSSNKDYIHFSRNTVEGFYSRNEAEIWKILMDSVKLGRFEIPLKVEDQSFPTLVLEAETIELVSKDDNRFGTTQILAKYNRKYTGKAFKKDFDTVFNQLSIDDCAKKCNQELGFECKSFDFCYLHGDCRLSKSKVSSNPTDFSDSNECDVYEKDSLYHYNEFPTKSYISKKDLKIVDVKSASDCASECDNQKKIHCRSFNFCPELNTCFLSENHVISVSEDGLIEDLVCSHYWRDYLSDFTFTSSSNISLEADLVFEGASVEQCSFFCVTSDGFNCKSFDYCPETKKCLLNKGSKPSSQSPSQSKDFCYNYRREYYFVSSSKTNNKKIQNNFGVVIGLGLGLFLVGVLIGSASIIIYMKKKLII